MQIYINGRHWIMKQLDAKGINYASYDNNIIKVDNIKKTEKIIEKFEKVKLAKVFDSFYIIQKNKSILYRPKWI